MSSVDSRKDLNRIRTISDIEEAFLKDYETSGIDGVNVSRICKQCNISRSTLYLYFDDKYSILQRVEDRLLKALWDICCNLPDSCSVKEATENAMLTLRHIRENSRWYRALLGVHGDPMFVYRWKRDMVKSLHRKLAPRNVSSLEAEIQGVLFSSALIGLYTYLIFEEPDISDGAIAKYMDKQLFNLIGS